MKTNNTVEKGPRWMFTWIVDSTNSDSSVVSSLLDTQVWMGRLKYYVYHLEMDAVSGRLQYVGYTEWNDRVSLLSLRRYITVQDSNTMILKRCPPKNDALLFRIQDSSNIFRVDGPWQRGIRISRRRTRKLDSIYGDIEEMIRNGMSDIDIRDVIRNKGLNRYYTSKAYDLVGKIREKDSVL
jgi:hypothetical protein